MKSAKSEKGRPGKPAFELGSTFWTLPRVGLPPSHLNVIVTDPAKSREEIAILNVTSLHRGEEHDAACVIEAGLHPAIKHRSFVIYALGRVVQLEQLERLQAAALLHRTDWPLTGELLARVQRGAVASAYTPGRVLELLRAQGFVK